MFENFLDLELFAANRRSPRNRVPRRPHRSPSRTYSRPGRVGGQPSDGEPGFAAALAVACGDSPRGAALAGQSSDYSPPYCPQSTVAAGKATQSRCTLP